MHVILFQLNVILNVYLNYKRGWKKIGIYQYISSFNDTWYKYICCIWNTVLENIFIKC